MTQENDNLTFWQYFEPLVINIFYIFDNISNCFGPFFLAYFTKLLKSFIMHILPRYGDLLTDLISQNYLWQQEIIK